MCRQEAGKALLCGDWKCLSLAGMSAAHSARDNVHFGIKENGQIQESQSLRCGEADVFLFSSCSFYCACENAVFARVMSDFRDENVRFLLRFQELHHLRRTPTHSCTFSHFSYLISFEFYSILDSEKRGNVSFIEFEESLLCI